METLCRTMPQFFFSFLLTGSLREGLRPSVKSLKKMFTSGTKTSKKAENVLMTWNAPDDHRLRLMIATSTKSKNWCLRIVG